MAITTAILIAKHLSIESRVANKAFEYNLEATEHLKLLISEGMYDTIAADTTHEHYAKVQRAESILCYFFALPDLSVRGDSEGGFVSSTGFNESRVALSGARTVDHYARRQYARVKLLLRELLVTKTSKRRPIDYLDNTGSFY